MGTMDYILDTISAVHPLDPLISLLNLNGKLVAVGLPNKPVELSIGILASGEPKFSPSFQNKDGKKKQELEMRN